MKLRNEVVLFIVAVLALAGAVVLVLTGHAVPIELWVIAGAALSGGLGLSIPAGTPVGSDLETAVSSLLTTLEKNAGTAKPLPAEFTQLIDTLGPIAQGLLGDLAKTGTGDLLPLDPVAPPVTPSVASAVAPAQQTSLGTVVGS